jgi:hypothetical protein
LAAPGMSQYMQAIDRDGVVIATALGDGQL